MTKRLWKVSDGNIGILFALILAPLLLAIGSGIDFARAYNVQNKMQSDLDAALLDAVKQVDSLNATEIKSRIDKWFVAQTNLSSTLYSISGVAVDTTSKTVAAKVSATVSTTFMQIAGIRTIPVSAVSTTAGPSTSYLQVYIVLDKSASMLLPSSQTDRTKFLNLLYSNSYSNSAATTHNYLKCEFACHTNDGSYFKYGNKKYDNIYDLVAAYNSANSSSKITLRTDTALTATQEVLDMVSAANATTSHIKVGLYYFGADLYQSVAPTYSTSTLSKALTTDSYGLTSATSQTVSYFNTMLTSLTKLVGSAGDGSTSSTPLKLVLLVTDGVQSARPWVTSNLHGNWDYYYSSTVATPYSGDYWNDVAPMNPAWCSSLKTNGVTIGVLNTEYLAIDYDWGYVATLSRTMASTNWYSTYGGVIRSTVSSSTSKRDYLQYALSDCASSSSLFIKASDQSDIQAGLSNLFSQYLNSIRLTN